MFPAAVWMRNVECPMNVRTAVESFSGSGLAGWPSTRAGHRVRGSSSSRGTLVKGWIAGPVGLKKRRPSK
jgi:hypothetical protein